MIKKDEKRKYLHVKDIQNIFGCSKTKAYEIIKLDGFPKIRIGRNYYIDANGFEKWKSENLYTTVYL